MEQEKDSKTLKTGTTTVGIVCKDGVVLAADRRATAGYMIVNKKTVKVEKITDNIALTMAGTVSDAQLLIKLIKAEIQLKDLRTGRKSLVKEVANYLSNMVYNVIRTPSMIQGVTHFVLGGVDDTGNYLFDIFPDGSVTLCDDFISSGSGSYYAYGVLDSEYKENMSVDEGVKLALRAVNAALQRDIASGNGVNVMVITADGAKEVISKSLTVDIRE
ncbi:proteasome subunit beta [Candidatus Woesearchaeota archaeon]|nr:proteasome subunit beta [Candidatus Woesearchaeota archaeon]